MHNLGGSASAEQANHLLLTPDSFVRTTLTGMKGCAAIVHVGPALGAKFTQYTAEFEPGGELGATLAQRFVFVMEGAIQLEVGGSLHDIAEGGYAYVPQGVSHRLEASRRSPRTLIE